MFFTVIKNFFQLTRKKRTHSHHTGEMSLNQQVIGGKKYFDRGVTLYFEIELIMNSIPNESPGKMGFIGTKQ